MTRTKLILSALAIFGLILSTGCSKDEAKDEGATPEAAKTTDEGAAKTDTKAADTAAADTAAAKPAAGGDMDREKLGEQMMTMMKTMAKAATDNKGNCDAMADAMQKIVDENKDLMEAGKSFDKSPENQKWLEEKYGAQIKEVMGAMMAPMMECQGNEKLNKVMETMK